jgi:hypothetical protein
MADTISLNGTTADDRPPRDESPPRAKPRTTPRAAAPRTKPAAATDDGPKRTPADRKLAASVAEMYQMLGMIGMGLAVPREDRGLAGTSNAFLVNAEAIAEAWMDLADKNPRVKAMLKSVTEVSAVGAVVGLHVTCILPFLSDRGIGGPIVANMAGGAAPAA